MNYTPGPWRQAPLAKHDIQSDESVVCLVSGQLIIAPVTTIKNGADDAKLIAAAPELLETLVDMYLAFNPDDYDYKQQEAHMAAETILHNLGVIR